MSHRPRTTDIPLGTLLKNYFLVLLGDQKNLIILVLSGVVVFLSMNMDTTWKQQLLPSQAVGLPNAITLPESISTVSVVATTTATSFSTLTVTEVYTADVSLMTDESAPKVTNLVAEEIEASTSAVDPLVLSAPTSAAEDIADAAVVEQEEHEPELSIPETESVAESVADAAVVEHSEQEEHEPEPVIPETEPVNEVVADAAVAAQPEQEEHEPELAILETESATHSDEPENEDIVPAPVDIHMSENTAPDTSSTAEPKILEPDFCLLDSVFQSPITFCATDEL